MYTSINAKKKKIYTCALLRNMYYVTLKFEKESFYLYFIHQLKL